MYNKCYKKLVLLSILWTLFLILLGTYVRLSDAGLSCPDWPGCYGHMVVPIDQLSLAKAQSLYPLQPIDIYKAKKEMLHRYVAGGLGLLICLIFLMGLIRRKSDCSAPSIQLLLLLGITVLLQGALGMWTVTLLLKPLIVTAHLLGGILTLVLLVLIYIRQQNYTRWTGVALHKWALFSWVILFLQIALGGWVSSNYAALACYDFPQCQPNMWIPNLDLGGAFHFFHKEATSIPSMQGLMTIHWLHRVGAIIASLALIRLILGLIRHCQSAVWGWILLILLTIQWALGIANIWLMLPIWSAVAHTGVATILLVSLTVISSRLSNKCIDKIRR